MAVEDRVLRLFLPVDQEHALPQRVELRGRFDAAIDCGGMISITSA